MFARVVFGARISLGLAITTALGAMLIGASIGGLAGYYGGPLDVAQPFRAA